MCLTNRVPGDELVLLVGKLLGHFRTLSRAKFICKRLFDAFGGQLIVLDLDQLLIAEFLLLLDFLFDIACEDFVEKFTELADSLVEEREQLVGLKFQLCRHLIDSLVLKAHSNKHGCLNIG